MVAWGRQREGFAISLKMFKEAERLRFIIAVGSPSGICSWVVVVASEESSECQNCRRKGRCSEVVDGGYSREKVGPACKGLSTSAKRVLHWA